MGAGASNAFPVPSYTTVGGGNAPGAKRLRSSPELTISLPNGANASGMNLNACNPNGIPINVMHNRAPVSAYPIASNTPGMNHNTFPTNPPRRAVADGTACRPNGHNVNRANFKHCRAKGKPMIVHASTTAHSTHTSAIHTPENTNHRTFPTVFMPRR